MFICNPGYLILFTIASSYVSHVKSKSSLPCASSAKLPSGEIADSHVAHGEIVDGANLGDVDMSLTLVPTSKSASRGDVLTSTPVHPHSSNPMLDRSMGYLSSDSISSPISGADIGEFHDLSGMGGSTSNFEQLLITSMSNLAKTASTLESNMNQEFLNLNDQMCIVESNHVTISDLKSEINDEFRSVRNDIAQNKSAIKSVENEISKNESRSKARFEIFTRFCTVDTENLQSNSEIDIKFQAVTFCSGRDINIECINSFPSG